MGKTILTGIKQSKYSSFAEAKADAEGCELVFARVLEEDPDSIEDKNFDQTVADKEKE